MLTLLFQHLSVCAAVVFLKASLASQIINSKDTFELLFQVQESCLIFQKEFEIASHDLS